MTTIRAMCPACGEVGVTPEQIELRVNRADATSAYYAFACPSCSGAVRKPADERTVRLLVSGGVEVLEIVVAVSRPRRLSERFDGPHITHDDLLDFHALLSGDDWFSALAAAAE